jgi:hypothetical protein
MWEEVLWKMMLEEENVCNQVRDLGYMNREMTPSSTDWGLDYLCFGCNSRTRTCLEGRIEDGRLEENAGLGRWCLWCYLFLPRGQVHQPEKSVSIFDMDRRDDGKFTKLAPALLPLIMIFPGLTPRIFALCLHWKYINTSGSLPY